jgi:hypothetical protein
MATPHISFADFATHFLDEERARPSWVIPGVAIPAALEELAVRRRVDDVLDTVVAMQRADWLQQGLYVGPQALGFVYRDLLMASRVLRVSVPPAIVSGCGYGQQNVFGTDTRSFLRLSSLFFAESVPEGERRFVLGRLCGHIAARQVTANTLYALVVDQGGLRKALTRNLGPVLEFVLGPASMAVRLGLSRWHRAAEMSADRAGLLCTGNLADGQRALLRIALGGRPGVNVDEYLRQLGSAGWTGSPGRWTELLAGEPWMHKRMKALELFSRSTLFPGGPGELDEDALQRETMQVLEVG